MESRSRLQLARQRDEQHGPDTPEPSDTLHRTARACSCALPIARADSVHGPVGESPQWTCHGSSASHAKCHRIHYPFTPEQLPAVARGQLQSRKRQTAARPRQRFVGDAVLPVSAVTAARRRLPPSTCAGCSPSKRRTPRLKIFGAADRVTFVHGDAAGSSPTRRPVWRLSGCHVRSPGQSPCTIELLAQRLRTRHGPSSSASSSCGQLPPAEDAARDVSPIDSTISCFRASRVCCGRRGSTSSRRFWLTSRAGQIRAAKWLTIADGLTPNLDDELAGDVRA